MSTPRVASSPARRVRPHTRSFLADTLTPLAAYARPGDV